MATNITSVQNKFKINNSQFLRLRTMDDVNFVDLTDNHEAVQQLDTFDQNLATAGNINSILKVLGKFIGVNICKDIVIGQNSNFNYALPTVTSLLNYLTEYGDGKSLTQNLAPSNVIFIPQSYTTTTSGDWQYYAPAGITFNTDVSHPRPPQSVPTTFIRSNDNEAKLSAGDLIYLNIFAYKDNKNYKHTEGLYLVESVAGSICTLGKNIPLNKNIMYFGYAWNGNKYLCVPNRNTTSLDSIKDYNSWVNYKPFVYYSLNKENNI